jgi:hypothetical protein
MHYMNKMSEIKLKPTDFRKRFLQASKYFSKFKLICQISLLLLLPLIGAEWGTNKNKRQPGDNFINILPAAFAPVNPKNVKRY